MTHRITAALIALLIPLAFAYLGGSKALGAHIWWDVKTAGIGAPIGVLIGLIAMKLIDRKSTLIGIFGLLTLGSFIVAKYGQIRFAGSYGEDALAGQAWFLGWISVMCFAAALLCIGFTRREP